ncbi:MAG: hypothetical protein Q9217_002585 [Psora testacea]
MPQLPIHIQPRSTPSAGTGLFTSHSIAAGKEILHIDRPLVAVLDSTHLQDACGNCFLWLPGGDEDDSAAGTGKVRVRTGEGEDKKRRILRSCLGCKVECHASAWKEGHRYECKIFGSLHPKILPNTVRLVMRLLLRRQKRSLSEDEWSSFLNLQSRIADFKAYQRTNEDGLTTWQTIELMSRAALTYSGSKESENNVQTILARLLINAHTLTTPTLDPLGLCLAPTALLNHSCTPNTHIVFDGPTLMLRSLASIPADTELTLSYVDTTYPITRRRSELLSRYFFTCTCPVCNTSSTNSQPDPPSDSYFDGLSVHALELQAEAATSSPVEGASKFKTALGLLVSYPPHCQPYPSILHNAFLNAIACRSWPLALRYQLKAYFDIDPIHYPLSWHPVRLMRKWVTLRLVVQVARLAGEGDERVQVLAVFGITWRIIAEELWKEVSDGARMSHGRHGRFWEEVQLFGEEIGVGGRGLGVEVVEKEWGKLRKIANSNIE